MLYRSLCKGMGALTTVIGRKEGLAIELGALGNMIRGEFLSLSLLITCYRVLVTRNLRGSPSKSPQSN